jgi:hypothetical protein
MPSTLRAVRPLLVAFTLATIAVPQTAAAQGETPAQREAGIHFNRAVQLYSEADYRAALVEFKRAYELAPHVTVLYNLGQTYYQLQNYAAALDTFERFLNEGGQAHRSEVEQAVGVLKTRVGKLDITTPTPGWEITIDDESVGKTPLPKPISVSLGRRKVTATRANETPITKYMEVAAGETAAVSLAPVGGATPTGPDQGTGQPPPADTTPKDGSNTMIIVGWVATGALAVGAVVTGIVASSAASKLDDERNRFPADKDVIDHKASQAKTFAAVTDVLAVSAIVVGGITLYFTLTKSSSSKAAAPSPTTRIGVSGSRLLLEGTF